MALEHIRRATSTYEIFCLFIKLKIVAMSSSMHESKDLHEPGSGVQVCAFVGVAAYIREATRDHKQPRSNQ